MLKPLKKTIRQAISKIAYVFWEQCPEDYHIQQEHVRRAIDRLKSQIKDKTPQNPVLSGFKVYSQTDEDGIIEHILSNIEGNRTCIEIGCGSGFENNTHYLILKGYSGYWVDGSQKSISFLQESLGGCLEKSQKLRVREMFVTAENISDVLIDACDFLKTTEPDFFSLDIDGNDLFILRKSLKTIAPKLICVEYNPKFPPPYVTTIKYNSENQWERDDYQGASLNAFCEELKDYRLICCNLSGANAFFVREDCAEPFAQYDIHDLYQPARFDLIFLSSGHNASLKWLRDCLSEEAEL